MNGIPFLFTPLLAVDEIGTPPTKILLSNVDTV
jgi:hypothetical protein